jgi:SAM-dependent methyltransferase
MTWDPSWDQTFSTQDWGRYPSEDVVRFVAKYFYKCPDRSAIKLLELGSGPGANLWYMAREGFSVYGVDGSKVAIEMARRRLDTDLPSWQGVLLVGDIGSLPYPDNTFDGIIDNEAIYANLFDSAKAIYAEVFRVLKVGGWLFSRTFATGCIGEGTGEAVGKKAWKADLGPLAGKGLSRFTAFEEITELLGAFKVHKVESIQRTTENQSYHIKEWVILAQKI